jgi:ribosomal-protein-alanine N-acetyltransferase
MTIPAAQTPRLELRQFSLDDVDGFFELNQDEAVIRFTGDRAFKDKAEVADFINAYSEYDKYGVGRWSVYLRETGEYIGFSGLKYDPIKQELDIGFRFMRYHWGKGYATESAIAALKIGFAEFKAEKIVGRCMADNLGSHVVLKKLGMTAAFEFVDGGVRWQQYELRVEDWRCANRRTNVKVDAKG